MKKYTGHFVYHTCQTTWKVHGDAHVEAACCPGCQVSSLPSEVEETQRFKNFYRCECGNEWYDEHSCMCNDRCPTCNREIEPTESISLPWFKNFYRCVCGNEWYDQHSCMCNDRCPTCNREIEPTESISLG